MADLTPKGRKYATVIAAFFLLAALGLGTASLFYPAWIKYRITPGPTVSPQFVTGESTHFIYHDRHRGLFYFVVDEVTSDLVKSNDGNNYFAVMYNYNVTSGVVPQTVGFWSITDMMKASVGLHIGYLVSVCLGLWLIVFSRCFGRRFVQLSIAIVMLGLIGGGVGLALFHVYINMEKTTNVPALPDIEYHWSPELKTATTETLYLSYGIHIGSFGASVLAILLIILILSSWDEKSVEENAPSDKVNIYTRDNLAYDDNMADRPARAELWNGFDRLSERRANGTEDRKLRANYPRQAEYGNNGHHHHHHHHQHATVDRGDERMDRLSTPIRQHYHADPSNYPMRY